MEKLPLTKRQIANLSVGLLGIQFGWGLQNANMSAIYEKLGASPSLIPLLWLAGPVSSLVAHPIIGFMSDRTWSRLGRRRPFLLGGAICSSIALFFMPTSPVLWIAATLLWVQDLSINSTMEPFRPFIADKLGDSQRTLGFAIQSFFIGLGAAFANVTPYILRYLGVSGVTETGVPHTVLYAFQFGAVFFLATVLWTVITTKEDPPKDLEALRRQQRESRGFKWVKEFFGNVGRMPATMRQFAIVQVFTWFGMFCIFMFFAPAVARHVFGATEPRSHLYNQGIEWAGVALGVYAVVSIGASLLLPKLVALTSRRVAHALSLSLGGLGLISLYLVHNQYLVLLIMVAVGFAWASIHAMPYAILSSALPPDRMGAYMGMFSFFIAVPGITASLTFRPLVKYVFDNNPLYVVMMGGVCFLIAASLMGRVRDPLEQKQSIAVKGRAAEGAGVLVGEKLAREKA